MVFPEFNATVAMQRSVFLDGVTYPDEKPVRRNALGSATSVDERPVLKPALSVQTANLLVDKKDDVWLEDIGTLGRTSMR